MLRLVGPIVGLTLVVSSGFAAAQSMADLFGTVASTVVVVQAKGREASGTDRESSSPQTGRS